MWRAAAALVAGACGVLSLPREPQIAWLACLCAVLLVAAATVPRLRWLAGLALGIGLTALQLHARLAGRLDPALEGVAIEVQGTVVSVPQGSLEALKFRFAPDRSASGPLVPRLIELTWYDAPERVLATERLRLEVKLRRPRGFSNPGGVDNEARMLREGLGASGYVRHGTRLGLADRVWWRHPVLTARAAIAQRIVAALGDRPATGIVAGLAVGLQDALSREQWLALSRSGTSHLMAISGLHIAMVAAVVAWAGGLLQRVRLRRTATRLAQRDAAVLAGALAALGYSLLAGWSVPTQRTMVMIACGATALLFRRRVGIADGLGLCAAAVVLLEPLAVLAPGFWLSFGAVAVILFGATGEVQRPSLLHGYLRVQAVVTLGLVPVLAGAFGSVSLVSPLVNLYAIPLYTLLVVPAVLLSCFVALVSPGAGTVLLQWTAGLVEFTWPLLQVPADWPLATWPLAALSPIAWAALVCGVLAALAPLPVTGRVAGVMLVVAACSWRPAPLPHGVARVTVLDAGQGLAAVVETRTHALVFDAGPSFRTGSDTGQLVVVPFLRSRGLRSLDALVVSHDDDDHKGGAASVLQLLPTRSLVTGPSLKAMTVPTPSVPRSECRRGERWDWDGVRFEWLHPGAGPYERDNDSSCVLHVTAGEHTALVTGDIEATAEAELLDSNRIGTVDVVVAPHHGSRTSSSAAFVAATRPGWVVYAVGHRNRWNFPATRVVERWQAAGAKGFRTSASGAITFELIPGRPLAEPQEWRRLRLRPWRDP